MNKPYWLHFFRYEKLNKANSFEIFSMRQIFSYFFRLKFKLVSK